MIVRLSLTRITSVLQVKPLGSSTTNYINTNRLLILVLGQPKWEDYDMEASLGKIARSCLKNQTQPLQTQPNPTQLCQRKAPSNQTTNQLNKEAKPQTISLAAFLLRDLVLSRVSGCFQVLLYMNQGRIHSAVTGHVTPLPLRLFLPSFPSAC